MSTYPQDATEEQKQFILNGRYARREGRASGWSAMPRIDHDRIPRLRWLVMFGCSPGDTYQNKLRRVELLTETADLTCKVGEERIVSIPERNLRRMGNLDVLTDLGFRIDSRPDFSALSQDRAYLEKQYTESGWVLGLSDADARYISTLGAPGSGRTLIKDPVEIGRLFDTLTRGVAAHPERTIWVYQSRNYADRTMDNSQGWWDKPQQRYRPLKKVRIPRAASLMLFTDHVAAQSQFAPEGEAWNVCEDVYRLLSEERAGGKDKFAIFCPQQTWITYWEQGRYEDRQDWQVNRDRIFNEFGYRLKHRSRNYELSEVSSILT